MKKISMAVVKKLLTQRNLDTALFGIGAGASVTSLGLSVKDRSKYKRLKRKKKGGGEDS